MASDPKLHGVIFDLDGLLVDTESIYCRAWQAAAHEQDQVLSSEQYVASVLGCSSEDGAQRLREAFGEGFSTERFHRDWKKYWRQYMESTTAVDLRKPGAEELLSFLKSSDIPMAVATSSNRKDVEESLRAARLDHLVNPTYLITADDVVKAKPDPQIYLAAAARLNQPAANCVVIEDSSPGVHAAKAAGMRVIVVPDMEKCSATIANLCVIVADSLFDAKQAIVKMLTA